MAADAAFYLDGGMMACGNTERSPAGHGTCDWTLPYVILLCQLIELIERSARGKNSRAWQSCLPLLSVRTSNPVSATSRPLQPTSSNCVHHQAQCRRCAILQLRFSHSTMPC